MAIDTGIVTIYDLKNNSKPLTCHRTDAREFLAHPSKRWSSGADAYENKFGDIKGLEAGEDSGEAMRLKAMTLKDLRATAAIKWIEGYKAMNKSALVEALLTKMPDKSE